MSDGFSFEVAEIKRQRTREVLSFLGNCVLAVLSGAIIGHILNWCFIQ